MCLWSLRLLGGVIEIDTSNMSAFTKQTPAESAALSAILEQNQGKPLRALTLAAKASGAFAGRATEDVVKNLKGGASYSQPVRLYSRAAFVGYKRGGPNSGNQYENVALVRIEGVRSKDDVDFYLGKRVAYIYKVRLPFPRRVVCLWSLRSARAATIVGAARSPPSSFSTPLPSLASTTRQRRPSAGRSTA